MSSIDALAYRWPLQISESFRSVFAKEHYLIKTHALIHALKEGFERKDIVMAVLNGTIIEEYDDDRALICGTAKLSESVDVYLHVVCEYTDPFYVEFVTAYIPDELQWERPPLRRRKTR